LKRAGAIVNRAASLKHLTERDDPWDLAVIGGGATGVGIAVDAASRGYTVCLLERGDLGKGTSSRSTKLIHGGVRYLQQGQLAFVREALRERDILRRNAPHLVRDLPFIVPSYAWWDRLLYGLGMKLYDLLAIRHDFGGSQWLSRQAVLERIPTLVADGLRGGILYHDGQFDDARLLINLAQTAAEHGAVLLNYGPVIRLTRDRGGRVNGVAFIDLESGQPHGIAARCVVNAAGPLSDAVRRLDEPAAAPLIAPSQGVHLVLDHAFLPGATAMVVPRTRDGRVLFAIPWHGHTLVGTTDTPVRDVPAEPIATEAEIEFLLQTAGQYFARRPTRGDILTVFAGIRPLVEDAPAESTAALSRDHTIRVSSSGLVTIVGGKWTTYRQMAEDCVDRAVELAQLQRQPCLTRTLAIHGADAHAERLGDLADYGADAPSLRAMIDAEPALGERLHPGLPIIAAQIVWAARHEMARTVEDVLARRTRALFLDTRAALAMAPPAARLLAAELGRDEAWQRDEVERFTAVAIRYLPQPT
jgi:glycerol-3-phosphate dehydrogenase